MEDESIRFSLFRGRNNSVLTKQYRLNDSGDICKESAPHFSNGTAETICIEKLSEIESTIDNLETNQCISTGVFDSPSCEIVTKGMLDDKGLAAGVRSRTIEHMVQPPLGIALLDHDIPILLWHIQGKSFSEIVSLRHAFLSKKDQKREILRKIKRGEISPEDAKSQIYNIDIEFTPKPSPIPNNRLRLAPLYPRRTSIDLFDFDTIVYDTYDYLDKVISLSLVDPMCAAFGVYFEKTNDPRALQIMNYIKYGTNDSTEIWLLRYGFGFDVIDWLKSHITSIDSSKITFNESIHMVSEERKSLVERYF